METIFVLRHGIAQEPEEVSSDFERKLTLDGKKKTKKLSSFFNKLEEEIEIVLSSPYLRTCETAEIFISELNQKPKLKLVDFLSCGASSSDIVRGLKDFSNYKSVAIVGHAPDLEIFTGKLIGGDGIKFKKGSLAKITLDGYSDLSGKLEWLITSKLLKNL